MQMTPLFTILSAVPDQATTNNSYICNSRAALLPLAHVAVITRKDKPFRYGTRFMLVLTVT